MTLKHDGGLGDDKQPSVSLVIFGDVSLHLSKSLIASLGDFFHSFGKDLPTYPQIHMIHLPSPSLPELSKREEVFRKKLTPIKGNIVIGVTRTGIWDPAPPRFIFGTSLGSGVGILSTCRFERDSGSKEAAVRHLEKEVIKILGLACHIDHCHDATCIMEYHNKVWDLDRNVDVCGPCMEKMGSALREFFDVGNSRNTGIVNFL